MAGRRRRLGGRAPALPDRCRDRHLHGVPGPPVPQPRPALQQPPAGARPEQDRRLPRPDRGDGDPDRRRRPRSRRRSGSAIAVWLTEYGRPAAGPRGRVGDRDRRRHAQHRARDLRPAGLPAGLLRLPLLHRRGRRRLRSLLRRRRGDDVADRAAAGRRRDAGGAERRSRATSARPPTRSARTGSRPSAASSCRPRGAGSPPASTLGMGRIVGDTAIVVILLGASLTARTAGRHPRGRAAAGDRQHPHHLRLQQLAGGGGQLAREGLRGRLRAADDRHRSSTSPST